MRQSAGLRGTGLMHDTNPWPVPGPGMPRIPMSLSRSIRRLLALGALALLAPVFAQSVALSGGMGERALIVIDEQAPVVLRPGESHGGVTLVSVEANEAVIDIAGQHQTL